MYMRVYMRNYLKNNKVFFIYGCAFIERIFVLWELDEKERKIKHIRLSQLFYTATVIFFWISSINESPTH